MRKWLFRIVMILLLAVFLFSAGMVVSILRQYKTGEDFYENAVDQFVLEAPEAPSAPQAATGADGSDENVPGVAPVVTEADSGVGETAPFRVDFDALKAINEDVVAWIYCQGTIINYPVLQAGDDDYYLHRSYDRSYLFAGSIFVEAQNRPGFQDANTIIYGHNMRDNSMFATLENWSAQSFYDQHPVMWLLTPERDYKIVLISGYTTDATSDTYQIFSGPGTDLEGYLATAVHNSDFHTDVALDTDAHYVVLSTCAYVFDNARYVLHGMLVPVDSAGGVPLEIRQQRDKLEALCAEAE